MPHAAHFTPQKGANKALGQQQSVTVAPDNMKPRTNRAWPQKICRLLVKPPCRLPNARPSDNLVPAATRGFGDAGPGATGRMRMAAAYAP